MTTLTLRIENHATLDNGGPVMLTLAGKGAQVGRKAGNDWVLPDPSRHISGHHFDISFEGGAYVLTDVSSNGTFLHGERYRIDGTHAIQSGDRFTVGHYIITAEIKESAPPPQPIPEPAPAAAPSPYGAPPPPADDFDDVWGNIGGAPQANTNGLQAPPGGQMLQPSPMPGVQTPQHSQPYPNMGNTLAPAPTSPPVFGDAAPVPGMGVVSAPPVFGTPPQRQPQPAPPAYAPPPPQPQPTPSPYAAPPQAPVTDGFGIGTGAAPAPYSPPPSSTPTGGTDDAFLRGFMEGAGLSNPAAIQIPPEVLGRILGQIARNGTEELMRMLQDRAAVKLFVSNEDRTMRVATGNNPMKFMPHAEQAFEALFLTPRDGYLTGGDGFDNALGDIRRHQAAVIAALQPALAEMLDGLAPDDIEAAAGGGMLGGGARKSWEEYTKRWETRAAQGDNGMLDAFIKAFSRHYADALRKL